MATKGGYPGWLITTKEDINGSKEWNSFTSDMHDAIQHQLKESHAENFTDLTDAERTLFVERAAKLISTGESYTDLCSRISFLLDQHVNNEVGRELLEDFPVHSKTDLVLNTVTEGAVSILSKWPDMKTKLKVMLNQSFPPQLRIIAWRIFLENTKLRQDYINKLTGQKTSSKEAEISRMCERLLKSYSMFVDISNSTGALNAMKKVLSHYCTGNTSKTNLTDIDYLIMVPFIYKSLVSLPRHENAPTKVIILLMEEYITFMERRPRFMIDSGSDEDSRKLDEFVKQLTKTLKLIDPATLQVLVNACKPSSDMIVTTTASKKAYLTDGLKAVIRPVIRSMFVGFLDVEVMLYIWDQYMLGIDNSEYHMSCLVAYTAIMLKLLKDDLKKCDSSPSMEIMIQQEAEKLQIWQFQYEINKHFLDNFKILLKYEAENVFPVLDPTQARPWSHWNHDMVPARLTPSDRRRARDLRLADRHRVLEEEREQWERIIAEEETKRRDYLGYLDHPRTESSGAGNNMSLLEEERRKRVQMERRLQAEIDTLRDQLRDARTEKRAPTAISLETVVSRYIMPAPPPTRLSRSPSPPTPLIPVDEDEERVKNILAKLVGKVHDSINTIAHGHGNDRLALDNETIQMIGLHQDQLKTAEIEVFGHVLKPGEFERLSFHEKEIKSSELMKVLQRQIIEERKSRLKPE